MQPTLKLILTLLLGAWLGATVFFSFVAAPCAEQKSEDRKSTRLNSSHSQISYAVFCLKKKKHNTHFVVHAVVGNNVVGLKPSVASPEHWGVLTIVCSDLYLYSVARNPPLAHVAETRTR